MRFVHDIKVSFTYQKTWTKVTKVHAPRTQALRDPISMSIEPQFHVRIGEFENFLFCDAQNLNTLHLVFGFHSQISCRTEPLFSKAKPCAVRFLEFCANINTMKIFSWHNFWHMPILSSRWIYDTCWKSFVTACRVLQWGVQISNKLFCAEESHGPQIMPLHDDSPVHSDGSMAEGWRYANKVGSGRY